ncbi:MAG: hypothetical protein EYC69_14285 [Bacteroidetes bacterium]|nr:MAG: hypothetical protein EYC69_14285 [Bacteroidota bacterium]
MRNLSQMIVACTIILCTLPTSHAQVTCNASGTWSGTAGWVPTAPVTGDNITVAAGCTLFVDISTVDINNLTVNGVVIITNSTSSSLSMTGNLIINSGASLINNGRLDFQTPGNTFNLNGTGTYTHNPFANSISDEVIFVNSNEVFSTTSNLNILKWFNGNVPLAGPTRVQSSIFGNVTLSAAVPGGTWDQDGFFSVPTINRIRGSLTVSTGTVVMDDGTGSTTALILQDVTVNGTGNIVFQRGYNRNYSLQVNNFSVNSLPPALPTVVLDTSFGILNMTVNGSMNIGHDFNVIYGHNFQSGADIRVTVNGNLNITGGEVIFNRKASAPLQLTVNGISSLNNSSPGGIVCFVEGASGYLTLNTQDLIISGGTSNYFYGMPGVLPAGKGVVTINVSNDFSINGTSKTYIAYCDTNLSKVRVNVSRDFTMNGYNAFLAGAYTNGAFTFKTARNFTQTNGQFIGQAFKPNISIDSIITGSNFVFNSGNATDYFIGNKSSGSTFIITTGNFSVLSSGTGYSQGYVGVDSSAANLSFLVSQNFVQNGGQFSGILSGSGLATFSITGTLDLNGGVCKIHNNTNYSNTGNISFYSGSIDFDGGVFSAFYNCNNNGLMGTFIIGSTIDINFTNAGDEFSFIGLSTVGSDVNNLQLTLTVPGGISIGGLNGKFFSSVALGAEFITLGSMTIANGTNSFNGQPGITGSIGHYVSLTINGNLSISGGDTYLSASTQTLLSNISGDLNISNGTLAIKGSGTTNSTFNILGGYSQTGGVFYMHRNLTDKMPEGSLITMNVNSNDDNNGNFTHTGGSFVFDNCSSTPASMNLILNVKSPNYTLGGTGQITMTLPGTGSVYGILNFSRSGLIAFNRSGSHNIQQVKQSILSGCTLDLQSGNMQVQSHNSGSIPPDALWVFTGATLDMRTNSIFSNATNTNSGISVFGRVRTQNVYGIYDGTTNAAFATNLTDNFDFYIAGSSTIEYYGIDNQIITGLGIGKAQLIQHKYGNLEINFNGTPDVEFVYPTNFPNDSVVMVRGNLVLTKGELNLDNDHDPVNGGGRWIVLESGTVTSMPRVNGYIRSESETGNARVKWIFNNNTGSHTFHFGYNSSEYIPLVFNHSSGSSATVYAATYHSDPLNLPYPPTVTHVRNNSGLDNSMNTVDRFWFIKTMGNIPSANLTFNCTPSETGSITNLVAQKWVNVVPEGWTNPPPGTQTSLSNGVQANSISQLNNWWTLSGNSVLLPIELLVFEATCVEDAVSLHWQTATEVNNDFFNIQKSTDGQQWETISQVDGAGNSSHILDYIFNDYQINTVSTYYKLTQTDFDGKSGESQIIKIKPCQVSPGTSATLVQSIYGKTELLVNSAIAAEYKLSICTLLGSELQSYSVHVPFGESIIPINTSGLSESIYLIRLSGINEDFIFKYLGGR